MKIDLKAECSVKIKKKVNEKIVRWYGCSLNKKSKNNHMHTKIIMFYVQIYSLQSDTVVFIKSKLECLNCLWEVSGNINLSYKWVISQKY